MPFKYPEAAVLRVEVMKASLEDKERICSGNMGALLGFGGGRQAAL
jgi:hypothetical protein